MPDPIKDLFAPIETASRSANLPEPTTIVALGRRRRNATAVAVSVIAVTVLVVGAGVVTEVSPFGNAGGEPVGPVATPSRVSDKHSEQPSVSPDPPDDDGNPSDQALAQVNPATVLSAQMLPGGKEWQTTDDGAGWGKYGYVPDPCEHGTPVSKTRHSTQYTRAFQDPGEVSLYAASAIVVNFPSRSIAGSMFDDITAEYEQCPVTRYDPGYATRHEISHPTESDLFVDEVQVMGDVEVPAHQYYRIHLAADSISIVHYGESENRSPTSDPTYVNELARLQAALLED